jgi:hypothetical protein
MLSGHQVRRKKKTGADMIDVLAAEVDEVYFGDGLA